MPSCFGNYYPRVVHRPSRPATKGAQLGLQLVMVHYYTVLKSVKQCILYIYMHIHHISYHYCNYVMCIYLHNVYYVDLYCTKNKDSYNQTIYSALHLDLSHVQDICNHRCSCRCSGSFCASILCHRFNASRHRCSCRYSCSFCAGIFCHRFSASRNDGKGNCSSTAVG